MLPEKRFEMHSNVRTKNFLQQKVEGSERWPVCSVPQQWVSFLLLFLFYFCGIFLFIQMHTILCFWMLEWGNERRPHSDAFMCAVLTRLNSPSERLMRKNGLAQEPTGCIHSCHHHLNPRLLNLQLWPPAWMGNDLSAAAWHTLCLQMSPMSSGCNNTAAYSPEWV